MAENELLRRTTSIAEELARLCDSLGQSLAAAHISAGIDILRAGALPGAANDDDQHVSR
jgi:hypothetical protein